MKMGHIWIACLALGALALAVSSVPADASSLEGHWEMHVVDINAPQGCKIQEDRVVILSARDGRLQGRAGMYFYRDIKQTGDRLKAQYAGSWDGVLGSKSIEAELNARKLHIRFEGRLSEDGDNIVTKEIIPCANHSGDLLNHVREYQTMGTLKRVDLAIGFVQRQGGDWRQVSRIDFGQPFRVEVRASRDLWLESYPITLGWLHPAKAVGQTGGYKAATVAVHQVSGDSKLYRSESLRLEKPVQGPAAAKAQDADGIPVVDLASGELLYAVAGNQLVLDFAAEAKAGQPIYLQVALASAGALLLAAWLAFAVVQGRLAALGAFALGRYGSRAKPQGPGRQRPARRPVQTRHRPSPSGPIAQV